MMKPGIAFEPVYRLMAEYRRNAYDCEHSGLDECEEYWLNKLSAIQNALGTLTDDWPITIVDDCNITVCHGTYEQTFGI